MLVTYLVKDAFFPQLASNVLHFLCISNITSEREEKGKSITSPFTTEEDGKPFAAAVLRPIGAVSLLLPFLPEQ